jgi:putative transposase
MATEKRVHAPGHYYHIYNRGNSKQKIFKDESDKTRFSHLLYLCNGTKQFRYNELPMQEIYEFSFEKGENLVEVCSWVLMDNHFHLLIFIPEEISSENISKYLARLTSSYLKYFNEKYERTGGLFEGRYKSDLISDDYHLKHLYSYIHLNPLKMMDPNWKLNLPKLQKAETYLNDYKYSSYIDLILSLNRNEAKILSNYQRVIEIADKANTYHKIFSIFHDPRGS